MRYGFEEGTAVPTCGPDIYFDEQSATADPMEVAREVFKMIIESQNPELQTRIFSMIFACGNAGCSEQKIAEESGCTRAAVSARVQKMRDRGWVLRPIGPMRQDITRVRCLVSRYKASMN
jgi:hypothetical protein